MVWPIFTDIKFLGYPEILSAVMDGQNEHYEIYEIKIQFKDAIIAAKTEKEIPSVKCQTKLLRSMTHSTILKPSSSLLYNILENL